MENELILDSIPAFQKWLLDPSFEPVRSFMEVGDSSDEDNVTSQLVTAFDGARMIPELVNLLIAEESKKGEAVIFRESQMTSRILKEIMLQIGKDYLRELIMPVITELLNRNLNLEVDEARSPDAEAAVKELYSVANDFVHAIVHSMYYFPLNLRVILRDISRAMKNQAISLSSSTGSIGGEEDYIMRTVGPFLFLRVICPAIITPQASGIIASTIGIDRTQTRNLVLIAKVIQTLANQQTTFNEGAMQPLNGVLAENLAKFSQFCRDIVNIEDDVRYQPRTVSRQKLHSCLCDIYYYVSIHNAQFNTAIRKTIILNPDIVAAQQREMMVRRSTWNVSSDSLKSNKSLEDQRVKKEALAEKDKDKVERKSKSLEELRTAVDRIDYWYQNPFLTEEQVQALLEKMKEAQGGLELKDRPYHLRIHKKCFTGASAVDYIVKELSCSREDAVRLGQHMLCGGALRHVTDKYPFMDVSHLYKFTK